MNMNTILTIGLAIAVGAAIYFIFQEIQQEKRKVEALSQHMRRLESLVWTYNIRPQPATNEYPTDTDVSDDEGHIVTPSDDEEEEVGRPAQIPVSFSVFSYSSGPVPPAHPEDVPQIEIVDDEAIPDVVSFDTTQRAPAIEQAAADVVTIEDEQDPPSPTHSEGEAATHSEGEAEPQKGHEEEGEPKPARVYADTAKNRRLNRVGLAY